MPTASEDLSAAVAHHQAGRLGEAEAIYRRVLQTDPGHPDALNLLGVLASQAGHFADGIELIEQAIARDGSRPDFQDNLAIVRLNQKRHSEAECAAGNRALGEGRLEEAVAAYRRAVAMRPGFAGALLNLGGALRGLGRLEEAGAALCDAIEAEPDFAEAHANLGLLMQSVGLVEEAEAAHRRAVALKPESAQAHYNLGTALQTRQRPTEAELSFREALAQDPGLAEAHANLGAVLLAQGRLAEAAVAHQQALDLDPDLAEAYANLASTFMAQGRMGEAVAVGRRALALCPERAEVHANLGLALKEMGQLAEAAECLLRALDLGLADPGGVLGQLAQIKRHLCDWQDAERLSGALLGLVREGRSERVHPFTFLAQDAFPGDQLACARLYAAHVARGLPEPFRHQPKASRERLRVGYLSADFQQHATAVLMAELIELHDRDSFEIIGYSYGRDDGGERRRRLAGAFDRFVDLEAEGHAEAARRIHDDDLDLLVDLKGFTQHARPEILALRPAPLQVAWLGFPGTLGADFIDYALVDAVVAPSEHQPFFAEKLVHLPGCYQANDRHRPIAATAPTRAACGLPEDSFVFCCFNAAYKITPAVFAVWMRLVESVPGAVLWLLDPGRLAADNLRREAAARGVDPARLVFTPKRPLPEYLAQYRVADLFLDTLPVNAHTTASDALWAGLPVVTCRGRTMAGRVAASLLQAVGLPELVTERLVDYEWVARDLAQDRRRLAALRDRLAGGRDRAALFDTPRFARNLERAFFTMVERHRAGLPPDTFAVEDA
ncbi:MAG TPA: tetratricopeptide repeat protein [Azospirillaceae bacterium]|nr:tetratricopeptide repeat protein [Azospirillaceae bacterium]